MPSRPTTAFTLLELLVVITIIVALVGLVISLIRPVNDAAKVLQTSTRMQAVLMGLSQLGQTDGNAAYRLQVATEYQASATPPDSEPGLGGIVLIGGPDPAATGVASGLPTIGKRPPPNQTQNYGDWGWRGRGHLAYPWGKQFPDPSATSTRQIGPERFRLRDLSPFNTRKLLTLSGILPTKAGDPAFPQTQYQTNRSPAKTWNDAWGRPLVVGAALYQPTWRTPSTAPSIPGWKDGAWPAPATPTTPQDPATPPLPFSSYGPTMETPVTASDRSARQALNQHLKLYQYNRSVYVAVAAVGPQAWVDAAKLTSNTASDWGDSPTNPTTGTLDELWSQANWVCQQAKARPFDGDWDELTVDNPKWPGVRNQVLDPVRHTADANRAFYAGKYQGRLEHSLLSAPTELK